MFDDAECESELHSAEENYSLLSSNNELEQQCGKYSCDNPMVRNEFAGKLNHTAYLDFLFFDADLISIVTRDRMRAAVYELNHFYRDTGITFVANVTLFQLYDKEKLLRNIQVQSKKQFPCESTAYCLQKDDVMPLLRGAQWKNRKIFQVIITKFAKKPLNGYSFLPGKSHGHLAMGDHVCV